MALGVDPDDVRKALRHSTTLISIMHANDEVGTIQPLEEIAKIAHDAGVLLHSDAAQSVGKVRFIVQELAVDLSVVGCTRTLAQERSSLAGSVLLSFRRLVGAVPA